MARKIEYIYRFPENPEKWENMLEMLKEKQKLEDDDKIYVSKDSEFIISDVFWKAHKLKLEALQWPQWEIWPQWPGNMNDFNNLLLWCN